MYLLMDRQGIGEEEKESLLARWMTMVMLTGHYQSGGEGTVLKDYANATEEGFASYLAQIEELKLTEEFFQISLLPQQHVLHHSLFMLQHSAQEESILFTVM